MANTDIQKQIEELKEEIKELENINTDKMIDVADEIADTKKRLKNLERIKERKSYCLGKSRNGKKSKQTNSLRLYR